MREATRRIQGADFCHLRVRQDGRMVGFTSRMVRGPVALPVSHVRGPGIPAKIRKGIVRWVAVGVTGFHPLRTRSDESRQDEKVDVPRSLRSETDLSIARRGRHLSKLSTFRSPYLPNRTHSVSRIFGDFPDLNRHVRHLTKRGRRD